jgi:hypothetical protein
LRVFVQWWNWSRAAPVQAVRVLFGGKKLCNFVHYCATEKESLEGRKAASKGSFSD